MTDEAPPPALEIDPIILVRGYDAYVSEPDMSRTDLFKLYEIFRDYMLHENQLIHERSIRGAGAQALIGTALGAVLGFEISIKNGFLERLAFLLSTSIETLHLVAAFAISVVGLCASLSTMISVRAAYASIDYLGREWESCIKHYLGRKIFAVDPQASTMKAEFLPSPVGGGKVEIHLLGSTAPKILTISAVSLWAVVTIALGIATFSPNTLT